MQNNDTDSYPIIPRESNSKWIKDLNIDLIPWKPPRRKCREEPQILILGINSQTWGQTAAWDKLQKISKWDIKLKNFRTSKKHQNGGGKKNLHDGKKNSAKHVSDKESILNIYKKLIQSDNKKRQSNFKMNRRTRCFFWKDIRVANRHMKRHSTSPIIKIQIKTTMRHPTSTY